MTASAPEARPLSNSERNSNDGTLHIQVVARLTNLTVDTIRAWQKRYAAVIPERGASGQRLFSPNDVGRLILLREAVSAGHLISRIASLQTAELRTLVAEQYAVGDANDSEIVRLLRKVRSHDLFGLASELSMAAVLHDAVEFADDIVSPLMSEIVENAADEGSRTTQLVLVSATLHSISGSLFARYAGNRGDLIVFLALSGEKHAVPPLLATHVALSRGYRAVYVGVEIAPRHVDAIVRDLGARGLGIHVGVNSDETMRLIGELRRRLHGVAVWVGGIGARLDPGTSATQTMREFAVVLEEYPFGELTALG